MHSCFLPSVFNAFGLYLCEDFLYVLCSFKGNFFLWVEKILSTSFFSLVKFSFFYKSANPFLMFATLSSILLWVEFSLSYRLGVFHIWMFLYVLTLVCFFFGREVGAELFLFCLWVIDADLLRFINKSYLIILILLIIMNHIKYHINSSFLGCKMASTILSDWKAQQITNPA